MRLQVPEVSNTTTPSLNTDMLLSKIEMAQATVGATCAVPMLVGPITMARLAKLTGIDVPAFTAKLVPVYQQLLTKLASMKVRRPPRTAGTTVVAGCMNPMSGSGFSGVGVVPDTIVLGHHHIVSSTA